MATIRIILRGVAIGSIPARLMKPYVDQQVVDIIRTIAAQEQPYV